MSINLSHVMEKNHVNFHSISRHPASTQHSNLVRHSNMEHSYCTCVLHVDKNMEKSTGSVNENEFMSGHEEQNSKVDRQQGREVDKMV